MGSVQSHQRQFLLFWSGWHNRKLNELRYQTISSEKSCLGTTNNRPDMYQVNTGRLLSIKWHGRRMALIYERPYRVAHLWRRKRRKDYRCKTAIMQ